MVGAWIADVTPLYERECYDRYYRELPDFRRKKADALRTCDRKAQSVGVWILWQKIRRAYGLSGDTAFNLSHSGAYVMCAACLDGGNVRVGCDLEKMGPLRMKVARRFFCPEEAEKIEREESEEAKTELFYRYWVLKESFMKATGKGMALPADSFCICLGEPPVLVRQPEEFPEHYHYREYCAEGIPCRMAVCSTDENIDPELHMELFL